MVSVRSYRILLVIGLLGGCVSPRERFVSAPTPRTPSSDYRIIFPDAVEIRVLSRPDWSGVFPLNAEGRIDFPGLESPRVEGDTPEELRQRLTSLMSMPPEAIQCRVAQFRGQMVFVYGPVKGPPRAVSYEGPEDVVSLLRRIGGLDAGAALRRIHVIRSNLQRNLPPQVFEVDVHAIVKKDDPRSNVVLLPLDEIYVDETSRSLLFKLLPEWLKVGNGEWRVGSGVKSLVSSRAK